jgi:pyruvate formate lyase activating enzyme
VRHRCQGLSRTYNEPTLWFEYTLDCARLAVERSLYTNYVTNGYMTVEALDMIGPYLDVFRVDVKGFSPDTYRRIAHIQNLEGVLKVTSRAKKHWNMHVEVVANLIPGINDNESELKELATWISEDLSVETPWHITRFYPRWKLSQGSPTSPGQLEKTRDLAMRVGLKYIYIGNLSGHPANHTYCPDCGKRVIERTDWGGVTCSLESGRCPSCGNVIAGRFK